jgi:hypothetical protein
VNPDLIDDGLDGDNVALVCGGCVHAFVSVH